MSKKFIDLFEVFLISKKTDSFDKDFEYGDPPTFGWFPNDVYDQNLMHFFRDIVKKQLNMEVALTDPYIFPIKISVLSDPRLDFDPNENIKEAVEFASFLNYLTFEKEEDFLKIKLYPKLFRQKLKKWIIMYLEYFFFSWYYKHKEKFTSESINLVVEATIRIILDNSYYFMTCEDGTGSIEAELEYLNPVVSWVARVNLPFLFDVVGHLSNLYHDPIIYRHIMYWLNSREYFPYRDLEIKEREKFVKVINTSIFAKEKSGQIPTNLFSEELRIKIRQFTDAILSDFKPLTYDDTNGYIPIYFETNINEIGYKLFLHFAYFGFVEGKVPGIKQGAYSTSQLEQELDEFNQFKLKIG